MEGVTHHRNCLIGVGTMFDGRIFDRPARTTTTPPQPYMPLYLHEYHAPTSSIDKSPVASISTHYTRRAMALTFLNIIATYNHRD